MKLRVEYRSANTFDRAVGQLYRVRDSLSRNAPKIKFSGNSQMRKFLNSVLTPRQRDSLTRLPVSNDELTSAIENMLTNIVIKDNRMRYTLFQKEQQLQDESRMISDQLRTVLSSLENVIIKRSYDRLAQSETTIENTRSTLQLVGVITFFLLLLFTWIIIRDLTSNQNYRQQLERLNSEKEDLLRSKMMLLATVTHDIQTPLGSVIGFSDLLKKSDMSPKQQQYLDNIKHSSHYILKLVNDLIDFSKLENDKISIEKVNFNFKDLIENTCRPLEPQAQNKHIELNWDIDDSLDANFISDPYRIKQIMTNLVSNAIKFTQEGSVEVSATTEEDAIVISVIDTGIGIAADKQSDIFREFTQAHAGIEKKFGGTGLGLTIARRMLTLLGGTIAVESVEGQGSIFTVRLPADKSASQTASYAKEQRETEHEFLRGKKILIVDDDVMQLTLMREIFANYPAEITTETDASKVLHILELTNFDIILSDIQMPSIDGFELVRQIRNSKNSKIATLPVVALSGKRDLAVTDFTSKGFTAFHPKPLQLDNLFLQLKAILTTGDVINIDASAMPNEAKNLFELRSLHQFTQNDPNAMRLIIDTFVSSSVDNCRLLAEAAAVADLAEMSQIAHKMIPMLKQMEVYSIVQLLEPIEEQSLQLTAVEMEEYVQKICEKLSELVTNLKLEVH
jgi:hypothetical protein